MKRLLLSLASSIILLCSGTLFGRTPTHQEKPIVVVTASYNNKAYYMSNLDSVFNQEYSNWHLIYIDDCSPDGTGNLVEQYITTRGFEHKVTLIKNSQRQGALANYYAAVHSCEDKVIIIVLDGDDFLANSNVLSFINDVYSSGDIWMTYGQFRHLSNNMHGFCAPMPQQVVENNLFRQYDTIPSHLRTFYAGLFKKIKKEDLQINNVFYPMTGDMATIIPMIEMASKGHFKFISQVLLVYNDLNQLNDHKVSQPMQRNLDLHIRSLPKYEALNALFS
jgi:glycosyltransferase involved in cell wall biosynthesis